MNDYILSLIYPVKQRLPITRPRASGGGNMPRIPISIITRSLIIARCAVCNRMRHILSCAAQFETITMTVEGCPYRSQPSSEL